MGEQKLKSEIEFKIVPLTDVTAKLTIILHVLSI